MSTIASTDMSNLIVARRLLEIAKDEEMRRSGKDVKRKSALDYMQEDQALISDSALDIQRQEASSLPPIENININLSDMHGIAKGNGNTAKQNVEQENGAEGGFAIVSNQSVEIKMELRYRSNEPMDLSLIHI